MKLYTIGSGCPDARAARFGSAFGLDLGDDLILVDCGPGTTYKMARLGLHPRRVRNLFLTHHHSDHNADVPCFLLVWWDQSIGTESPLTVYGPPPTEAFIDRLLGEGGVFRPDIEARLQHPASHECHRMRGGVFPRPAPAFQVRELHDGETTQTARWQVRAAAVKHVEPSLISLAYRFDTPEGSIVFAGDCTDCPALRELAAGVDTLVIACTHFGLGSSRKALVDCVAGVEEAAAVAAAGDVERVVLTHMSPNFEVPETRQRAVDSVKANCQAGVICPDELTVLDL